MNKSQSDLVRFYLVENHPVKIAETFEGGLTAFVLNKETGEFFQNGKYVLDISFGRGDIEEVSEKVFNERVLMLITNT